MAKKTCGNCRHIVFDDIIHGESFYRCTAPVAMCVVNVEDTYVEESANAKNCKAYKPFKFKEVK